MIRQSTKGKLEKATVGTANNRNGKINCKHNQLYIDNMHSYSYVCTTLILIVVQNFTKLSAIILREF